DLKVNGKVAIINSSASPATGMFEVKVRIEQPVAYLKVGLYGTAKIFYGKKVRQWSIPLRAFHAVKDKSGFVYIPSEQSGVKKMNVDISEISNGEAILQQEVVGLEYVITESARKLSESSTISIKSNQ
ncbi:MAG: hypothetical protein AAFO69_17805, partial [Bacteroidota bacterium]